MAVPLLFILVGMGRSEAGFTMIEILMVVAIAGVVAGISVPSVSGAMREYALNGAGQTVAAEIRRARFTAVATRRTVRVRFNCPGPGQFRVVEVVGVAGIDEAGNRCSDGEYPFPDPDPATAPNTDGQLMRLPQGTQFSTLQDLEITPRGRFSPLEGCPSCVNTTPPAIVAVTNGVDTRSIIVSASGHVELQ